MSLPARMSRNWVEVVGAVLVAAFIMALFTPVVAEGVTEGADYLDHIRDARLWAEAGLRPEAALRPHFVYHLLVIVMQAIIPSLGYTGAAFVVTLGLHTLLALIFYGLVRPLFSLRPPAAISLSILTTIALMLAAPITILTWDNQNLYFGYLPLHVPHNPTQIALKPFALLFFLYAVRAFQSERSTIRSIGITFILGLVSTLAKPSYAICLLPAAGLLTTYRLYRQQTIRWRLLILGVVLPVSLVLAWQYLLHRSSLGGFGFEPFKVMLYYSPGLDSLLLKLALSILFPAVVYIAYFRQARTDLWLNLNWLTFAVGAAYTYLLLEPRDWPSGNFLWSGQITLLILFWVSALFFIRQNINRRLDGRFFITTTALALHVISGIFWYYIQINQGMYAWW